MGEARWFAIHRRCRRHGGVKPASAGVGLTLAPCWATGVARLFPARAGGEQVAELLTDEARVSALNWSELHQKLAWYGLAADDLTAALLTLGVQVEPFSRDDRGSRVEAVPPDAMAGRRIASLTGPALRSLGGLTCRCIRPTENGPAPTSAPTFG